MSRAKQWRVAELNPAAQELAARLKVCTFVAQVLLNRGISQVEQANQFLRPNLMQLHSPDLLPGLQAAAARIARAVAAKQKIVIYGDYDVDGITATAILWHAIRILGGVVDTYIPHRIDEGYGVNAEAVTQIIDAGAQLIVTVDCGITAVEQAKIARQRGVDLIITDHHDWHSAGGPDGAPVLPDCFGIVHPRLPGEKAYPNVHLCGAGVAFKLAWGIGQALNGAARVSQEFRAFLIEATALAALGTIADVVPLTGENRILAAFGLGGLKQSKLTGIRALIESAALTGQTLDSYHVGFLLAPRLNACGRMGHARLAVEMLTSADAAKATEIATYLEAQNRARQTLEKEILRQAMAQIESNGWDNLSQRALVLSGDGWHAGVIGIVASRIVDRLGRPTIMIALNNGQGQGSARSIAGFHLAHALQACGQHLLGYGGHEMAAGLKIETRNIEPFRAEFCDYARDRVSQEMLAPDLPIDGEAQIAQLSPALVHDLKRMGPFGHGNRRPLLCLRDVTVAAAPRRVGKTGDHLQLSIRQGNARLKCILFNAGDWAGRLGEGSRLDLAGEPMINNFTGYESVEMEIKDVRMSGGQE